MPDPGTVVILEALFEGPHNEVQKAVPEVILVPAKALWPDQVVAGDDAEVIEFEALRGMNAADFAHAVGMDGPQVVRVAVGARRGAKYSRRSADRSSFERGSNTRRGSTPTHSEDYSRCHGQGLGIDAMIFTSLSPVPL